MATDLSHRLAFGTYQDALRMVGVATEPRTAGTVVSAARIQLFAALVRDANPSYWDAEFAANTWGGLLAPPALLMGWLVLPPWLPTGDPRVTSIALRVPLPGTTFINAANEAEFPLPIVEGDRLTVVEEVLSVSPEKRTRLGVGHFVETQDTYSRQDNAVVARNRNTLFRFTSDAPPRHRAGDDAERSDEEERRKVPVGDDAGRGDEEEWRKVPVGDDAGRGDEEERRKVPVGDDAGRGDEEEWRMSRSLDWDRISVPAELPEVVDEISYQRVVMNSGATWDYFPGHFDPTYAESQGHPTIFVNTMHLAGFADRIATDWAGPDSRVVRRKMTLTGSIYAGDTMVGQGRVVAKRCDTTVDPPRYLLELQIQVTNQRGVLCCPVELTLQVPGRL